MFFALPSLFASGLSASSACNHVKSHFQDQGCCAESVSDVCSVKGVSLINGGGPPNYMNAINFFHRGVGPIDHASKVFAYGLRQEDVTKFRGRMVLRPAATLVTDNIRSRDAITKHDDASAKELVEEGHMLVSTPTNGILYLIPHSYFYNSSITDMNAGPYASADLFFKCGETPSYLTAGHVSSEKFTGASVLGPVLKTHDGIAEGTDATVSMLGRGKKNVLMTIDTVWCPTCMAGLGQVMNPFAPAAAWALDVQNIFASLDDLAVGGFYEPRSMQGALEMFGCPIAMGSVPPEGDAGCDVNPNNNVISAFEAYLVSAGAPIGLASLFLSLWQSSIAPDGKGYTEGALNGLLTPIAIETYANKTAELGILNTGVDYFYDIAPNTFVDAVYGGPTMPALTQSGFMILEAATGKTVVRHTPAFLIGQFAPQSRLVLEHIAFALGVDDLVSQFESANGRVDFTPEEGKFLPDTTPFKIVDRW